MQRKQTPSCRVEGEQEDSEYLPEGSTYVDTWKWSSCVSGGKKVSLSDGREITQVHVIQSATLDQPSELACPGSPWETLRDEKLRNTTYHHPKDKPVTAKFGCQLLN